MSIAHHSLVLATSLCLQQRGVAAACGPGRLTSSAKVVTDTVINAFLRFKHVGFMWPC